MNRVLLLLLLRNAQLCKLVLPLSSSAIRLSSFTVFFFFPSIDFSTSQRSVFSVLFTFDLTFSAHFLHFLFFLFFSLLTVSLQESHCLDSPALAFIFFLSRPPFRFSLSSLFIYLFYLFVYLFTSTLKFSLFACHQ